jgi:hypothetical protein
MKRSVLSLLSMCILLSLSAQKSLYEPVEIEKGYEKATRSRTGSPGDRYWQNSSDYDLKVSLDPESGMLNGSGTITYYNNSPDTLRYLVLKLLPNIHKKGNARDYTVGPERLNSGMVIDSLAISDVAFDIDDPKRCIEYGTNLYLVSAPSDPVPPGSVTELFVKWNYEVIRNGIRNGAFTDSAFFIGYWYPQMAVYDDIYGWDREDYTGKQETYNDLGNYRVEISVPDDYVVWATGDQQNEDEIFSGKTLELIQESRESSESIAIIRADTYRDHTLFRKDRAASWYFTAENVPDFAWACSNYYNWDANTLVLDDDNQRDIWISAVYPPQNHTFDKVADAARQGIVYLSEVFPGIPYPFNKHTTFNGIHKVAVEYPMMANNSDFSSKEMYHEVTVHEIAHNYIPFFMLSNERRHAWVDEGWVKLIGELHGETIGIQREDKKGLNTLKAYERFAGTADDLPLIVPSGFMTVRHNFYHSYAKATHANLFLLELMKEKGIGNPLKPYLLAWQGKHPTPYDFFNYMNTLCGEDLSWFWDAWYFTFNYPDLEIARGNGQQQLIVHNRGGIPLPVHLKVVYNDGTEKTFAESIWRWADRSESIAIKIPDLHMAEEVVLGAPHIPDINRANNRLVFDGNLATSSD